MCETLFDTISSVYDSFGPGGHQFRVSAWFRIADLPSAVAPGSREVARPEAAEAGERAAAAGARCGGGQHGRRVDLAVLWYVSVC